jgi:hypothetical protein
VGGTGDEYRLYGGLEGVEGGVKDESSKFEVQGSKWGRGRDKEGED